MGVDESVEFVLAQYGTQIGGREVIRIGSGHINKTYSVGEQYLLQRVNTDVFTQPEIISENLRLAAEHLQKVDPDYFFIAPIKNQLNEELTVDPSGGVWRLFTYVRDAITIDQVSEPRQAYLAAQAFGRLSRLLSDCDVSQFKESIPRFHDLTLRYRQFETALRNADLDRRKNSENVWLSYVDHKDLVQEYQNLINSKVLKLRVMHNDTKINNVLFSKNFEKVLGVVDLDTLMPGYFIYDLGDMVRTMVSPVSEEESDMDKMVVLEDFVKAIYDGYLSEMGGVLTVDEKATIPLAGPIMTYTIGLRFLTDYLNGDRYFNTSYPGQNLIRATNQLTLLERLRRSQRSS